MNLYPQICHRCSQRLSGIVAAANSTWSPPTRLSSFASHSSPPTLRGNPHSSLHLQSRSKTTTTAPLISPPSSNFSSHATPRLVLQRQKQKQQVKPRAYHSYDYPAPAPFPPAETAILSAALQKVPEHGFTTTALSLGAREAGYLDISKNLFPRGVFDLVRFHLVTRRLALADEVQFPKEEKRLGEKGVAGEKGAEGKGKEGGSGGSGLSVEDKVKVLMMRRLRANADVVGRWPEALRIMAQPANVGSSLAELGRLADEFLFLAGDTTVDTRWYTKRASLSAIYSAAEVYQATRDRSSVDFLDTERFLDARLDGARRVGYAADSVQEWVGFTAMAAVNVLRSKGVRI